MTKLNTLWVIIILILSTSVSAKNIKPSVFSNGERKFKSLTLDNEMKVLLVSDSNFKKSYAALDVKVGSFYEPDDKLGLAHFLEHLLFIRSKKFPIADEFTKFVEESQGNLSARTEEDFTNYYFSSSNQAFEEGLDRFSRFFIDPIFDSNFVGKEIEAINSEANRLKDSDTWRIIQTYLGSIKSGHPLGRYSTGSKETLKNTSEKDVKKFYEKYYSSNIMSLVILSPNSLSNLEKLAINYFGKVKNKNVNLKAFSKKPFKKNQNPQLIKINPLKDRDSLYLAFSLPSLEGTLRSQPFYVLESMLEDQSKGSLFSVLKSKGLVEKINLWKRPTSSMTVSFVKFKLTKKGLGNYNEVIKYFYAYINLIKKTGYTKKYFHELNTIDEGSYLSRNHIEKIRLFSNYAREFQFYTKADFEKVYYVIQEYNDTTFKDILNQIKYENMTVILISKDLKTNSKEPYLGANFKLEKIKREQINSWESKKFEGLSFPRPNKYISSNLNLLEKDEGVSTDVLENKWGKFVFKFDNQFKISKTTALLKISGLEGNDRIKDQLYKRLYVEAVKKSVEEWTYLIARVGGEVEFNATVNSLDIEISTYSEKFPLILREAITKFRNINISKDNFTLVKESLKKDIKNNANKEARYQAKYFLDTILIPNIVRDSKFYDEINGLDSISSISLDELKSFSERYFSKINIEGAAVGNIEKSIVENLIKKVPKQIGSKEPIIREVKQDQGFIRVPQKHAKTEIVKSHLNNSAVLMHYQCEENDLKSRLILEIGEGIISSDFFTQLRTIQQTGYIVKADNYEGENICGINLLIQSSKFSPREIATRIQTWVPMIQKKIQNLTNQEIEKIKDSIVKDIESGAKTQREALFNILEREFSSKRKRAILNKEKIKLVKKLRKIDIVKFYEQLLNSTSQRLLAIFIYKNELKIEKMENMGIIKSIEKYKKENHVIGSLKGQ